MRPSSLLPLDIFDDLQPLDQNPTNKNYLPGSLSTPHARRPSPSRLLASSRSSFLLKLSPSPGLDTSGGARAASPAAASPAAARSHGLSCGGLARGGTRAANGLPTSSTSSSSRFSSAAGVELHEQHDASPRVGVPTRGPGFQLVNAACFLVPDDDARGNTITHDLSWFRPWGRTSSKGGVRGHCIILHPECL